LANSLTSITCLLILTIKTAKMEWESCVVADCLEKIPTFLMENRDLFFELLSLENWRTLHVNEKEDLKSLLPSETEIDHDTLVKDLLSGKNFYFGNPLEKFFMDLHNGVFHPDIMAFSRLFRRAKYKDYLMRQKDHYSKLVKDILPSRQVLLDVASLIPADVPIKIRAPSPVNQPATKVYERASLEYYRALADVRQDVADDGETSSEDEAFPDQCPLRLKTKGFSSSDPCALSIFLPAQEIDSETKHLKIVETMAPEVDPVSSDSLDDKMCFNPSNMELHYKRMLKRHKRLKTLDNNHRTDLDTNGISLNDIIFRTELSLKNPHESDHDTV